jgi:DNA-binding MltR family transcriptional regulator
MTTLKSDILTFAQALKAVQQRTHSTTVIASAAIMDTQLEKCLKKAMRPMSKKMYEQIFEPMRPLGSFASKITMAYALRVIEKEVYAQLELMRKIRNAFAHSTGSLHFGSPEIAPLLERLKASVKLQTRRTDQQYMECVVQIDQVLANYLASRVIASG